MTITVQIYYKYLTINQVNKKLTIMSMEQLIFKLFNLIALPLAALFLPLQLSMIILGFIFIIRFILSLFVSLKERGYKWYRFDKIFHHSVLEETLRLLINYTVALLLISLFETFIIGTVLVELLDGAISLTRFVIILVSAIELSTAFEHLEKITNLNLLDKIISVLPSKLKLFFEGLVNNKTNDNT